MVIWVWQLSDVNLGRSWEVKLGWEWKAVDEVGGKKPGGEGFSTLQRELLQGRLPRVPVHSDSWRLMAQGGRWELLAHSVVHFSYYMQIQFSAKV